VPDIASLASLGGFLDFEVLRSTKDYFKSHVQYHERMHLESLGLIQMSSPNTQISRMPLSFADKTMFKYFGTTYSISFDGGGVKDLAIQSDVFTSVGNELYGIAGAEPFEEYRDQFIATTRSAGFTVEIVDR
jgi:hypothetical protein